MKEDNENKQTDAEQKQTDATKKQTDAEQKQTDAEQKQTDAKTKETPAKTKETPAETPKSIDDLFADLLNDLPPDETPKPPDETPKPTAETPKPPAGTLKPLTIDFYIDGKQVHFPFDDLSHFNELRAQLASGTTLNDDLITKMKPIFAEARL